jgi:streptomycin 6-kinase
VTLPPNLVALWQLTDLQRIAETPTSTVWKVTGPDGQPAALKLLRPGEVEEERGVGYLQALDGQGAVRVLARDGAVILMEWCGGPSLGDLVRAGQDEAATEVLCDTIRALHTAAAPPGDLQPLGARFLPLTASRSTGDLAAAADLARALLASTPRAVALHGDLHQDNILLGPRGWLAIDPKGVHGDPAYEPANAFRNPDGAGDLPFRPKRIAHLADRFSQRLSLPRQRLLGWAAAHCALSTFWSREAGQDITDDLRLLPLFLTAAGAAAD